MRTQIDIWFIDNDNLRSVLFDDIKRIDFLDKGTVYIEDRDGWSTRIPATDYTEIKLDIGFREEN